MEVVDVTFSIWSPLLEPSEITSILGVDADREVVKGSDRVPARYLPKAHGWHLTMEFADASPAELCLQKLMDRVSGFHSKLARLRSEHPECEIRITVYLDRSRRDQSLDLSVEMLAQLNSLFASVFFAVVDLSEGHA